MKKKLALFLGFLLLLVILPVSAYADDSEILIGGTNIYNTPIDDTAIFDKNTNTLTLNNYNGPEITVNLPSDATFNLVLKGENILDSGKDIDNIVDNVAAIEISAVKEVNVVGEKNSSLDILHYDYGILLYEGDLNIDKATINGMDSARETIKIISDGDISITNSKITNTNMKFSVGAYSGALTIKDSTFIADTMESLLYATTVVSLDNVTIDAKNIYEIIGLYAEGDKVIINNSNITLKDSDGLIINDDSCDSDSVEIKNSTINAENISNSAFNLSSKKTSFIDSTFNFKNFTDEELPVINIFGGKLYIDNSKISASNLAFMLLSIVGEDSLSILDSDISIDKAVVGMYTQHNGFTIDNSNILIKDVSSGIEYYPGSEEGDFDINNSTLVFDNSESDKHLVNGLASYVNTLNLNKSEITIKNNSDNEFYVDPFYASTMSSSIQSFELGIFGTANVINIKDSKVNIESKYTQDVENKFIKSGILNIEGIINIDNSEIHVDVDENGAAIGSVVLDTSIPEDMLTLTGNNVITNEGYEIRKYIFTDAAISVQSIGDENVDVSDFEYETLDEVVAVLFSRLPNKLDIEGTLNLTYSSNDENNDEVTVKTTGVITNLPTDIFASTDTKKFTGWSLTTNGDIITSLNMDEDKTIYAIWNYLDNYTYNFLNGDNQEFESNGIDKYSFRIDGDYALFTGLEIGNLDLVKDEDFIVTEGSTIITFTQKGISKLNTLKKGVYDIIVKYSNSKEAKGKLIITDAIIPGSKNPNTGNDFTSKIVGITKGLIVFAIIDFIALKLLNKKSKKVN